MDYSHLALTALAPRSAQEFDSDIIATVGPDIVRLPSGQSDTSFESNTTYPSTNSLPSLETNTPFLSLPTIEPIPPRATLTLTLAANKEGIPQVANPTWLYPRGIEQVTPFRMSPTPTGTFTPTRMPPTPSWTPFHLTATETASFTPTNTFTYTPELPTWTAVSTLSVPIAPTQIPTQPPSGLPPKGY
jgi:hypothetical protein